MADVPGVDWADWSASSSPFVAKNSSRRDARLAFNVSSNYTRVSEDINVTDNTDRVFHRDNNTRQDDTVHEDVQLLDAACRHMIKETIKCTLMADMNGRSTEDKELLRLCAQEMWQKACTLPQDIQTLICKEQDAVIGLWLEKVDRARVAYSNAAGSSLNSLVQTWHIHDYSMLAKELAVVGAKYGVEALQMRGQQLAAAFDAKKTIYVDFHNNQSQKALALLGVLRGAQAITDRSQIQTVINDVDEREDIDRTINTDRVQNTIAFNITAEWWHMVMDATDASGDYIGNLDDIVSQGSSLGIPITPF